MPVKKWSKTHRANYEKAMAAKRKSGDVKKSGARAKKQTRKAR